MRGTGNPAVATLCQVDSVPCPRIDRLQVRVEIRGVMSSDATCAYRYYGKTTTERPPSVVVKSAYDQTLTGGADALWRQT